MYSTRDLRGHKIYLKISLNRRNAREFDNSVLGSASIVKVASEVRTEAANRLRDFTWNLGTLEEGYGT